METGRTQRDPDRRGEVTREEFIRRRPEASPEQGAEAGPDAPETLEPTQGERPGRVRPERDAEA